MLAGGFHKRAAVGTLLCQKPSRMQRLSPGGASPCRRQRPPRPWSSTGVRPLCGVCPACPAPEARVHPGPRSQPTGAGGRSPSPGARAPRSDSGPKTLGSPRQRASGKAGNRPGRRRTLEVRALPAGAGAAWLGAVVRPGRMALWRCLETGASQRGQHAHGPQESRRMGVRWSVADPLR
jgi:hypothetical protein